MPQNGDKPTRRYRARASSVDRMRQRELKTRTKLDRIRKHFPLIQFLANKSTSRLHAVAVFKGSPHELRLVWHNLAINLKENPVAKTICATMSKECKRLIRRLTETNWNRDWETICIGRTTNELQEMCRASLKLIRKFDNGSRRNIKLGGVPTDQE